MNNQTVKKKKMKRSDVIFLAVLISVLTVIILAAILIPTVRGATRLDRAERKLTRGDYIVQRIEAGDGSPIELDADLEARVTGLGGPNGEYIYVMKFKEKAEAESFYEAIKDQYTLTQTAAIHGRYVYYGTRTTYEMIK